MPEIRVKVSPVFTRLNEADAQAAKIKILEGGSRSSKTWSIIQTLIEYCHKNTGKRITVCRAKLTWLKQTVLKDFVGVLKLYGMYNERLHNKTENIITLNGNEIAFIGLDEKQKLHGRTQDRFWINEAVEATREDFDQLEMRTSEDGILDYNPNTTNSWIYTNVEPRPDAILIHSTMLDNPFLPDTIRKKIQSYEPTPENIEHGTADEYYWQVYGLGMRADVKGLVYNNIRWVEEVPPEAKLLGNWIDFGYTNDPTSVGKLYLSEGELWADELIYESGLTNQDITRKAEEVDINRRDDSVADSAEPKSIEELRREGWNVEGARKGQDSITQGIDVVKRYRLNITTRSKGLREEARNYKWQYDKATDTYRNKPVDAFNHSFDGIRYVCLNKIGGKRSGVYDIR